MTKKVKRTSFLLFKSSLLPFYYKFADPKEETSTVTVCKLFYIFKAHNFYCVCCVRQSSAQLDSSRPCRSIHVVKFIRHISNYWFNLLHFSVSSCHQDISIFPDLTDTVFLHCRSLFFVLYTIPIFITCELNRNYKTTICVLISINLLKHFDILRIYVEFQFITTNVFFYVLYLRHIPNIFQD